MLKNKNDKYGLSKVLIGVAFTLFLSTLNIYSDEQKDIYCVKEYMRKNSNLYDNPEDYTFRVVSLVNKSIKVVSCAPHHVEPLSKTYLLYPEGKIEPLNFKSLTIALKKEFPKPVADEDRSKIVEIVLRYNDASMARSIIKSIKDIPGYEKSPLKSDILLKRYRVLL